MEYTTTISSEEYKELILKAIEYNNLKEENEKLKERKDNIFEKMYIDKLYDENKYDIKNTKNKFDYNYKELMTTIQKDGIYDLNFIDKTISELKERYAKENPKVEKENE